MNYRCPFRVAVGNGPQGYVYINCNKSVAHKDPFLVVRVFFSLIQLTHFSISLTSNGWITPSKTNWSILFCEKWPCLLCHKEYEFMLGDLSFLPLMLICRIKLVEVITFSKLTLLSCNKDLVLIILSS